MAGTILVRLAHSHGIYKEHYIDGGEHHDIHITGFDPEDGQVIRTENGQVLTPIHEVPRSEGVLRAIAEKRLIDVRDDDERVRVEREVAAARTRRQKARAANAPATAAAATAMPVGGDASAPVGADAAKK